MEQPSRLYQWSWKSTVRSPYLPVSWFIWQRRRMPANTIHSFDVLYQQSFVFLLKKSSCSYPNTRWSGNTILARGPKFSVAVDYLGHSSSLPACGTPTSSQHGAKYTSNVDIRIESQWIIYVLKRSVMGRNFYYWYQISCGRYDDNLLWFGSLGFSKLVVGGTSPHSWLYYVPVSLICPVRLETSE